LSGARRASSTRTRCSASAARHGRVGRLLASAAALGGANEQQTVTVTGTPTGGTFTLTYNGATTATSPSTPPRQPSQTALEALPNIGAGNVAVSGGALPGTPVVVTFQNQLGKQNVAR
jgi:hypothetical protein